MISSRKNPLIPRRAAIHRFLLSAGVAVLLPFQKMFGMDEKKQDSSKAATSQPMLGEIMLFSGNYAPQGWAFCEGQILPIAQNTALFSLLGTMYGGNGTNTFALPDLRGRAPIHYDNDTYYLGQIGGESSHTLFLNEVPSHTHNIKVHSTASSSNTPLSKYPGASAEGVRQYASTSNQTMDPNSVSHAGSGQAHNNMPPYLTMRYVIAFWGIYPSRP